MAGLGFPPEASFDAKTNQVQLGGRTITAEDPLDVKVASTIDHARRTLI